MSKPNFFIVGAAKCGTTAMYSYLQSHPDIFMSVVKEPNYFSFDRDGDDFAFYRDSVDHYLSLFDGATGQTCIGEASPSYLPSVVAPQAIYDFDSASRIIIMLRNPVDMVNSIYHHRRFMGAEQAPTLEQALRPELNGEPTTTRITNTLPYLQMVDHTENVKRYLEIFPREQIHVIIYDDFRSELATVYRETLIFLGTDPDFQPDFSVVNASKTVRSSAVADILGKFNLSPSHIKKSSIFQSTRRILPDSVYERLIRFGTNLYTRPAAKDAMEDALHHELNQYFQPTINTLSQLINRDLTYWYTK